MLYQGVTTRYVYKADGMRLKRIDDAGTANERTTLTFGPVEIRNFGTGASEIVSTNPLPNIRLVHDSSGSRYEVLHTDQLGSVRLITGPNDERLSRRSYKPFGSFAHESNWDLIHQSNPKDCG